MSALNWGMIQDGGVFESLMHSILFAEDAGALLFGRPGKDAGQDARSADGRVVYQAKYRQGLVMDGAIDLALEELAKIKEYRQPSHVNHIHWGHAQRWVLVANVSINSNDDVKWQTAVVPAFRQEGLPCRSGHDVHRLGEMERGLVCRTSHRFYGKGPKCLMTPWMF